jgi:hypothetical protein
MEPEQAFVGLPRNACLMHRSKRRPQPEFGKIDVKQKTRPLAHELNECISALTTKIPIHFNLFGGIRRAFSIIPDGLFARFMRISSFRRTRDLPFYFEVEPQL